jgi:predicted PurR-regulated permease PerM
MTDQDAASLTGTERSPASTRHLAGTSPAARKVAGARRNPSVVGYEQTAPHWLRVIAGMSWRLLVVTAAIVVVFYATSRVQLVFIAVFIALVFTAVLRPIVDALARIMPRGLATAFALLLGVLTLVGMLTYVAYSVAGQWQSLSRQFTSGIDDIINFLEDGPLPVTITNDQINDWINEGRDWVIQHGGEVASQAAASAGSVVQVFGALALATFCSVFFLARGREIWVWFLNQLPARYRETWQTAAGAGWYTFSGYTRGTVIIALSDGVLAFIVLLLLKVPLAAPLAVLVLIGAFIPLVGAPAAMIIAMVIALAANGPLSALLVGVGIAAIGQFEGHILQPVVMGRQVSLHPLVIALVVTGGTITAGILGAVISVPLVAVAWAVFSKLRRLDPPLEVSDVPDSAELAPVEE